MQALCVRIFVAKGLEFEFQSLGLRVKGRGLRV
jgi:hypothetical protein